MNRRVAEYKITTPPNYPNTKMNRRVADFVFSNVKTREFTYVNDRSLNHAEKAEDAPLYSFWEGVYTDIHDRRKTM